MPYNVDKIIEEFNKENSNDCILGQYLGAFIHKLSSPRGEIDAANIDWDKKVNDWLTSKLQKAYEAGQEEIKEMVEGMEKTDLGEKVLRHEILGVEFGRGYNKALQDVIDKL